MQKELDEIYTYSPIKDNPMYRIHKRNFEEYVKKALLKSNLLDKKDKTDKKDEKELLCKHIFDILSTPFGKAYIYRYISFQEQLIEKIKIFKEFGEKKGMKLLLETLKKFEKEVLEI